MLNNYVLVGRLTTIKTIKTKESERTVITLAVPRSYKNIEGIYETDFISCTLLGNIAESTKEYCKKGDIIGVRGRLQKLENKKELTLLAEKITFLSSRKAEDGE